MSKTASDAGAVAARQGFKYQDHVAASFVLHMVADAQITKVECETADDVLIVSIENGSEVSEYVQVKTTEGDRKWSIKELCDRDDKSRPTSLAEKSLLSAKGDSNPQFRIVSKRALGSALEPLMKERRERAGDAILDSLAKKFAKKWKTKSASGLDLEYWAQHLIWQCPGSLESLKALNERALSIIANRFGANPTQNHIEAIYNDLLKIVDEASSASRVTSADKKVLRRPAILEWWAEHMSATEAAIRKTSKPYRAVAEQFFVELHHVDERALSRAMTGYDVQYEFSRWRADDLAEYLAKWLPEMTLKASELVEVGALNLREKARSAMRQVARHKEIDGERLLAETLLHAVLRHRFKSEPIACKLFFNTTAGAKSFGSAHIVHTGLSDQLWLGRATLARIESYNDATKSIVDSLNSLLDPDFLKEEREVIVTLREPNHLLPTTLEATLASNSPIDQLLRVIALPILLAYESDVLSAGFKEDYRDSLIAEVNSRYNAIKDLLPDVVEKIHVHVFFVPVESVASLTSLFMSKVKGV